MELVIEIFVFTWKRLDSIKCVENLLINDDQVPTPLHDRFQSTTHLFRTNNTETYYTVYKDGENTTGFPSSFMFHTTYSPRLYALNLFINYCCPGNGIAR